MILILISQIYFYLFYSVFRFYSIFYDCTTAVRCADAPMRTRTQININIRSENLGPRMIGMNKLNYQGLLELLLLGKRFTLNDILYGSYPDTVPEAAREIANLRFESEFAKENTALKMCIKRDSATIIKVPLKC